MIQKVLEAVLQTTQARRAFKGLYTITVAPWDCMSMGRLPVYLHIQNDTKYRAGNKNSGAVFIL
jgi:hypothetical protein